MVNLGAVRPIHVGVAFGQAQPHPGQQLGELERFGHVVVGATF